MLFSPVFFRVEAIRQLRNPYTLVFTLAMPIAMYLLFGAGAAYGDMSAGHGNVRFYVMCSMAAFGAATAMSSLCSLAASEVGQGWGRQLAMTPMRMAGYAAVKLASALCFAALATVLLFIVGAATGARAEDAWRWVAVGTLVLAGSLMFGLFGLGVGLAFNSDSSAALASIAITFFGFFGNVFMPLDGVMLDIARFTPMYGYAALMRWPITEGALMSGGQDPLWLVLASVAAWTAVFAAVARIGVLRSRRRR
ncbi:ABC transporter permease [Microbacterium sp. gxy059]|uniref:ABC transporter permease n=1 Tax=Microbacterium sp. gxy059 TaxID=2957199 RepID=UPI003D9847F8